MKTVDKNYTEQDVNDLLQEKSSCQTDGGAIRDYGLLEKPNRLVKRDDIDAIDEERKDAETSTVSMYRNESG